jgi:hypothetical protein
LTRRSARKDINAVKSISVFFTDVSNVSEIGDVGEPVLEYDARGGVDFGKSDAGESFGLEANGKSADTGVEVEV